MDLKYFIFFTLGLFLLVAGCTKAELSGAAGVPLAKSAVVSSCTETDRGRDYSIRGVTTVTLSGKATLTTDSCTGNQLTEYYCDAGAGKTEKLVCPQGMVCSSGRCIVASTCASISHGVRVTDNSNGVTTTTSNSCVDEYTLRTVSCTPQGTSSVQTSKCPEGTFCSTGRVDGREAGQCVREVGCEQYDSSVIISNSRTGENMPYSNYCSNGQLIHYYCTGEISLYNPVAETCPQGFECKEGGVACTQVVDVSCGQIRADDGLSGVRIVRRSDGSTQDIFDSCRDAQTSLHYACGQSAYSTEQFEGYYSIALPSREGQVCENGAFVQAYTCQSTRDVAGNPTVTRTIVTYRDGHTEEQRSACASSATITIPSCFNSQVVRSTTQPCSVYGGRYNTCATINGVDQCISQAR